MGPFLPFDEGSDVLIASIHPNLRTVTYQSSRGVLGQKYIVRAVYEDGPSGSSNQAETLVGCSATVTVDDVLVDRAKVIRKVKKGDSYRIHGLGTMNQGSILRVDSKLKDQSGRPIYGDILITKLDIAKLSNVVCPR
jgi:hypothetical protein